jgi:diacylglycerol kinase family enzyme
MTANSVGIASNRLGKGTGVVAILNVGAGRMTPALGVAIRNALPDAEWVESRSVDEAREAVRRLARTRPRLLVSGGGDGAVTALINLWGETGAPLPPIAVVPLGTGNAWAHAVGAPALSELVPKLKTLPWPLPIRRFNLLEVCGVLCPFAGGGWDGSILEGSRRFRDRRFSRLLPRGLCQGVVGYLVSLAGFSLHELTHPHRAHVKITAPPPSLALTADQQMEHVVSSTLYEGSFSVVAMGTEPEYGFGFKAFPFASAAPGRLNLRVYDRSLPFAVADAVRLWRGLHPIQGMHDFFVSEARLDFDRPVRFQVAGDSFGLRTTVEVRLVRDAVELVDWSTLFDTSQHVPAQFLQSQRSLRRIGVGQRP